MAVILKRIEAKQITTRPSVITSAIVLTDEILRDALTDWQQLVGDSQASVHGSHMHPRAPMLTVEEWEAQAAYLRTSLPTN